MQKEGLFSYFPKYTRKRFFSVLQVAPSFDAFWQNPQSYKHLLRWDDETFSDFLSWKSQINESALEAALEHEEIQLLSYSSNNFPAPLKEIPDGPTTLFVKGTLPQSWTQATAIVGTRKYTPYGAEVTKRYVTSLNRSTIIVSGLAHGIDTVAHSAALEHGMVTVAILAGGVHKKNITPRENFSLSEQIVASGGCLISEFPPGTEIKAFHFPRRNRIIAGLAENIVVTEAPKKSGALITAHLGADYNKDVYTIPHPITSLAGFGCNELLTLGATPIIGFEEAKVPLPQLSRIEAFTLEHLERISSGEPLSQQYRPEEILQAISLLEIKGIITRNPDFSYSRTFL